MTVEYETIRPAPPPISQTIARYLGGSISIGEILKRVLRGWFLIIVGIVAGFLYGLDIVWASVPMYTAEMSLLPADAGGTGGVGGEGTTLDLLAGLAGYGSGSVPKFARFAAAMSTPGVARILDQRYNMTCRIFAGQCDIRTGKWRERVGRDAWWANLFASLGHLPDPNGPRTVNDLANYISASVVLQADKKNHMVDITFSDRSPKFAAEFLTDVVQASNDYIKMQDQAINHQYVDYLTRELADNANLSQHQALSDLLVQQERSLMLTGVNLPYAATPTDNPVVTTGNNVVPILILYATLGFFFGCAGAVSLVLIPDRLRLWVGRWKRS